MSKFKFFFLLIFISAAVFSSYLGRARLKRSSALTESSSPSNPPESLMLDSQHCHFESDHGPAEAYLKNGQVYLVIQAANSQEYYLMKDACLLSWQEGYSTGTKFCYPLSTSSPDNGFYLFPDEISSSDNLDCQTEDIPDSLFFPPPDLIFSEVAAPTN